MEQNHAPNNLVYILIFLVTAGAMAFTIHTWGRGELVDYATIEPAFLAGVATAAKPVNDFLSRRGKPRDSAVKLEAFAAELSERTIEVRLKRGDFPREYAARHDAYQRGDRLPPCGYLDAFLVMYGQIRPRLHPTVSASLRDAWQEARAAISRSRRRMLLGVILPALLFTAAGVIGWLRYTDTPPLPVWSSQLGGAVGGNVFFSGDSVYAASDDGYLYDLNAATGGIQWKTNVGHHADSSPCVADGIVYIGSWDTHKVYALDAATGKVIWTALTGSNIESSPVVYDGVVYIGSEDGDLYALKARTGALVWHKYAGGVIEDTPAVAQGVVYVGSWSRSDSTGYVYAFAAESGERVWSRTLSPIVHSSPVVAGNTVYVGSTNGDVYALNATTSDTVWTARIGRAIDSSPAVAGNTIYVGDDDGSLYALNANTRSITRVYDTSMHVTSGPVVDKNIIYVGSYDDSVYGVSTVTHTLVRRYSTSAHVEDTPRITPKGTLYIGSDDGKVYAFNTATGSAT